MPTKAARSPEWKRRLAVVARWLHIYLSLASFAILFFFAITGLTLNHTEWFAGGQRTVQHKGLMPVEWLGKDVSQLAVVEHLRARHEVKGALSDFRVDGGQCTLTFKGPGYSADVFIDRASGKYELTETRLGLVAVINDLHKGRDSGKAWSSVIDLSAVLMCVVSLTGFVLIFFLQKRRFNGLLVAAIGLAAGYAIYALWVP